MHTEGSPGAKLEGSGLRNRRCAKRWGAGGETGGGLGAQNVAGLGPANTRGGGGACTFGDPPAHCYGLAPGGREWLLLGETLPEVWPLHKAQAVS